MKTALGVKIISTLLAIFGLSLGGQFVAIDHYLPWKHFHVKMPHATQNFYDKHNI